MNREDERRRMRRSRAVSEEDQPDRPLIPAWNRTGLLVALLAGGILLLWPVEAGYGLWAGVILLIAGGSVGLTWMVSSIRVALAWVEQQRQVWAMRLEERHTRLVAIHTDLEKQQAEIELMRRRANADELKAQATYLAASAQAAHLHMRVEHDQAALRAGLYYPDEHGYPVHVALDQTGRPRIRATDYRALLAQHTSPQPALASPDAAPAVIGLLPLPGPLRDIEVLRGWDLRPDHVYLATGRGGQAFACSVEGWHHIAHDARTGGGKTLLARLELAMMLTLGVDVVLCNPHFAPIDRRGHDWRPIGYQLERKGPLQIAPGVRVGRIQRKTAMIRDLLCYLAQTELDRRYDRQAQGIFDWTPLYVFTDEVPWLTKQHPEIVDALIAILQRGRAVDVRLVTNAQSFLVGNTGLGGGSRDNFGTAHFLGGNPKSGAAMLGMAERDLKLLVSSVQNEVQQELGKGVGLLRNLERVPNAEPVRVPYGTNDLQYYLLGRHDDWQLPEFRGQPQKEDDHPYWTWTGEQPNVPVQDARIVDADTQERLVRRPLSLPSPTVQPPVAEALHAPGEPPDVASGTRPKEYRLSDAEIVQFITAYRACGSMDKALAAIGRGARYRKHASDIVRVNSLRHRE